MTDERYRERFEDTDDMTIQRYFNEQDAITAFQFWLTLFVLINLAITLLSIYLVTRFII